MIEEWRTWKEWYTPWNAKNPKHHITEVSNKGNIRRDGIILKQSIDGHGYCRWNRYLMHRLVAELFIPNPENKPCIDHIDTNKQNNNVENLRWVTYSENMRNPITYKNNVDNIRSRNVKGENNPMYNKHHKRSTKKLIHDDHIGRTFINNGEKEKFVKPEELDYYLNNGFIIGRLPFSNETRLKISKARAGKRLDAATHKYI